MDPLPIERSIPKSLKKSYSSFVISSPFSFFSWISLAFLMFAKTLSEAEQETLTKASLVSDLVMVIFETTPSLISTV